MSPENAPMNEIRWLALSANPDNVGDIYVRAVELYAQISSAHDQQIAEDYIAQIRSIARRADIGWKLFASPPAAPRPPTDDEQIQLMVLIGTLHSFCYGAERLDEVSLVTGPDSTPVRFYINSLYHYTAALYLLDKHQDPIGGMVYKTLQPMALAHFLDPISQVLDKPMNGLSFGETVRQIRNDFLVHGTFSPDDIASVVSSTKMRDLTQVIRLASLIWELFNQSFILKLKLLAVLTQGDADPAKLVARFAPSPPT